MSIEAQAEVAESFVREVVRCFGISASTTSSIRDDTIHVSVEGSGVGILIGSRGVTIDALQELTRTAVQRSTEEYPTRIHVDVGGYRARRAAALQQFAHRVAEEVIASGESQALEPMSAPDRKVVHDSVTEIDGVATSSEGEDPRRYVVIRAVALIGTAGGEDSAGEDSAGEADGAESAETGSDNGLLSEEVTDPPDDDIDGLAEEAGA